jgi:hypothetical protein
MFEAGAIFKKMSKDRATRVCAYLYDMRDTSQLQPPLSQFQAKLADKDGTFHVVSMINAQAEKQVEQVGAQEAFVDYYDERTGSGFQRQETLTPRRGREVADYVKECVQRHIPWRLFEMTANVRGMKCKFIPLDDAGNVGVLEVIKAKRNTPWLSIIDGGTRFLGIRNALADGSISPSATFDVRIFIGLTLAEEIALFLLINQRQKKVRTDLALRVVQRRLDEGDLSDAEATTLESVVPEILPGRFRRIVKAGGQARRRVLPRISTRSRCPAKGVTKSIKLQAMLTSLEATPHRAGAGRVAHRHGEAGGTEGGG